MVVDACGVRRNNINKQNRFITITGLLYGGGGGGVFDRYKHSPRCDPYKVPLSRVGYFFFFTHTRFVVIVGHCCIIIIIIITRKGQIYVLKDPPSNPEFSGVFSFFSLRSNDERVTTVHLYFKTPNARVRYPSVFGRKRFTDRYFSFSKIRSVTDPFDWRGIELAHREKRQFPD